MPPLGALKTSEQPLACIFLCTGPIDTRPQRRDGFGVSIVRGLGGCAASHVEGTGPARALRAILAGRPWVVVTVPALVLCARLLGASAAAPPHMWKEQGQPVCCVLSSRADRGSS